MFPSALRRTEDGERRIRNIHDPVAFGGTYFIVLTFQNSLASSTETETNSMQGSPYRHIYTTLLIYMHACTTVVERIVKIRKEGRQKGKNSSFLPDRSGVLLFFSRGLFMQQCGVSFNAACRPSQLRCMCITKVSGLLS